MAPHAQTTLVLSGFSSLEEMTAAKNRMEAGSAFQKAHQKLERGTEPAYDSQQRILLRTADFSLEIVPLGEKLQRPEIRIFHRSGIHPILYADTLAGPDMPNLIYIIPFASLADRERAWDTFGGAVEWLKVREESIAEGGQIVDYQILSIWQAAPFSPIQ
jgi:hypothetical protein